MIQALLPYFTGLEIEAQREGVRDLPKAMQLISDEIRMRTQISRPPTAFIAQLTLLRFRHRRTPKSVGLYGDLCF